MIHKSFFISAHSQLLNELVEMKKSIDLYRSKENHSKYWLKKQESQLIIIGNYAKAVQYLIKSMHQRFYYEYDQLIKNYITSNECFQTSQNNEKYLIEYLINILEENKMLKKENKILKKESNK